MEITVIRHLPTEWNKNHKLQGYRDIKILPITESDQKEISENLKILKGQTFDYVLCSTLKRTQETAELYGYEPKAEPLLNELDFGPFEGLSKEQLINRYGETWIENPKEITLGESLINLENRIISFLGKYKDSSSLLVFGHGSWIRALKSYYQYGHINNMNKTIVKNNECISLEFLTVEV